MMDKASELLKELYGKKDEKGVRQIKMKFVIFNAISLIVEAILITFAIFLAHAIPYVVSSLEASAANGSIMAWVGMYAWYFLWIILAELLYRLVFAPLFVRLIPRMLKDKTKNKTEEK